MTGYDKRPRHVVVVGRDRVDEHAPLDAGDHDREGTDGTLTIEIGLHAVADSLEGSLRASANQRF